MSAIEVKKANQDWKSSYLDELALKRKEKLNKLSGLREEFLAYEAEDKCIFLLEHIFELSICNDDEVITLLESMGVGGIVHNYFVDAEIVFDSLDKLYEKSIYLFPYEFIWGYYKGISELFFYKQLAIQFKIDLDKEFNKLRRKENKGNLEESEKQDFDILKKLDQKVKQDGLELRVLIKKDKISSSIRKSINLPHKITIFNLFITIRDNNLEAPINGKSMTRFYSDFYDLMKILLRDKTILNDKPDSDVRSTYKTKERFKTKRVKSLLKLKGYGSYE